MPLQPRMADSVEPDAIPRLYATKPNGVAVYRDGKYAWPEWALRDFPYQWGITVTGDPGISQHCRVIDVERGDATPADVKPYREARAVHDGDKTIVYCDRSTVLAVVQADDGWSELEWWIATLDNRAWTAEQMSEYLYDEYRILIPAARIRAIQNRPMGSYDVSAVFGDPGWLVVA